MSQKSAYSHNDIIESYENVGISTGRVVVVAANLGKLFNYESPGKNEVLEAHYSAIQELLGDSGTLVVRTASTNLFNTDVPFNLYSTPSWKMGPFSEHVRLKPKSLRSFHPFVSISAVGRQAETLTRDASRNPYGHDSPEARMIDLDALCVSVGVHPRLSCSTVHHAEILSAVPYRYIKEFMHPVERDGTVNIEPWYGHVWYREIAEEINSQKQNRNVKIFEEFSKEFTIRQDPLGRGVVYAYSMAEFFNSSMKSMKEDPYIWLGGPPRERPYSR